MTAPLSQDLRRRIARSVAQGSSIRQAAARYEVSPSAAVKLLQRVRRTGSLAPDRIGGHRRPVLEPHADLLRSLVAAKSGITLAQIQTELKARGIVVAALSTILLTLRRLGLRHKKRMARPVCKVRQWRVWSASTYPVSGVSLAKMDSARLGPNKDSGVEHHIFVQTSEPPVDRCAISSSLRRSCGRRLFRRRPVRFAP
jgi:transposase